MLSDQEARLRHVLARYPACRKGAVRAYRQIMKEPPVTERMLGPVTRGVKVCILSQLLAVGTMTGRERWEWERRLVRGCQIKHPPADARKTAETQCLSNT